MFPSTLSSGLVALLAFVSMTSAHLVIKTPVPFNNETLNNSPLVDVAIGSATSDFPCKQRPGVYKISQMNNMTVGEPQTLSFTGSASHGGGTCQLAVSLDKEPTAASTWKIIQVYEGGCPITAAGNAGTDDFTYKIPEKFPNGQATLAWTWYNRIGNREIYMNCAPIMISGGANDDSYYNTLPDMYVINLPSSSCSTKETTNQIIPNPGQFVLTGDTGDQHASATGPACDAAAAAQTNGVSGYQGAPASNAAGSVAASTPAVTASTPAAVQSNNNGQYTQPAAAQPQGTTTSTYGVATPAASGMTTMTSTSALSLVIVAPTSAAAVIASTAVYSAPVAPLPSAPASSGSNETETGGHVPATNSGPSCSPDGAVICNGATQFGLCNFGSVIWQDVAAGTTCANGVISKKLVRKDSVHFRRHFGAPHS